MTDDTSSSQTLIVQILFGAAGAPDTLHASLQHWIAARATDDLAVGMEGVFAARIPSAEIDGFARDRGWSAAPDALLQIRVPSLEAAREFVVHLPDALEGEQLDRRSVMLSHEVVQLEDFPERWENNGGPVKMIVENHPKDGMSLPDFFDHWRNVHGPLVALHGPAMGYRRYAQHYPLNDSGIDKVSRQRGWRRPPLGGITEVWWTNYAGMVEGLSSEAGVAASQEMGKDEVKFVGAEHLTAFLATETRWGV